MAQAEELCGNLIKSLEASDAALLRSGVASLSFQARNSTILFGTKKV